MQKVQKWLILLMLFATSVACSTLGDFVQKPTMQFQDVKYRSVSVKEGVLDSRVQINNPNAFSLPVRNIVYSLKINERELANSSMTFDKSIPANGSIQLQFPVHFLYGELLNSISSLLQNRTVNFQLGGEVDFGVIKIPFSKSGSFALR